MSIYFSWEPARVIRRDIVVKCPVRLVNVLECMTGRSSPYRLNDDNRRSLRLLIAAGVEGAVELLEAVEIHGAIVIHVVSKGESE